MFGEMTLLFARAPELRYTCTAAIDFRCVDQLPHDIGWMTSNDGDRTNEGYWT